jgi:hypothetical protein
MPAAARVRDACTHASCESSCRWAKKSHTGAARSLADWIGVGAAKPAMEQEVARLGKAGEGRLARVSELVLLRPCAYDWLSL